MEPFGRLLPLFLCSFPRNMAKGCKLIYLRGQCFFVFRDCSVFSIGISSFIAIWGCLCRVLLRVWVLRLRYYRWGGRAGRNTSDALLWLIRMAHENAKNGSVQRSLWKIYQRHSQTRPKVRSSRH
jgi:hypothetical protein